MLRACWQNPPVMRSSRGFGPDGEGVQGRLCLHRYEHHAGIGMRSKAPVRTFVTGRASPNDWGYACVAEIRLASIAEATARRRTGGAADQRR